MNQKGWGLLKLALSGFLLLLGACSPAGTPGAGSTPTRTPVAAFTLVPALTETETATPLPYEWKQVSTGEDLPRDIVSAIAVDPNDSNNLYAGTQHAGIYKSTDAGVSWQLASSGLTSAGVDSLVIDPQNPHTLYAGILRGGIYKTTDGAATWHPVNNGIANLDYPGSWESISHVLISASESSQAIYYLNGSGTVYQSTNAGETWQPVAGLERYRIINLAAAPANPGVILAESVVGNQSSILKSIDGGSSWTQVLASKKPGSIGISLYTSQDGQYAYSMDNNSTFYYSSDAGETWQSKTTDGYQMRNCFISPTDGRIISCDRQLGGRYISIDLGQSWHQLSNHRIDGMAFVNKPEGEILASISEQGLMATTDGGLSWKAMSHGMAGTSLTIVGPNQRDPNIYLHNYRETVYRMFYYSSNGGITSNIVDGWWMSEPPDPALLDADGSTIYSPNIDSQSRGVYPIIPGRAWQNLATPFCLFGSSHMISADPFTPGKIYAFCKQSGSNVLFISTTHGQTWGDPIQVSIRFDLLGEISLIFTSAENINILHLTETGLYDDLYQSTEGGHEWAHNTLPDSIVNTLSADPHTPSQIFIGMDGSGIFTSTMKSSTWKKCNNGLGNLYVNTIAFDPNRSGTVYAGTDAGVYVSFDSGLHWAALSDGLPGMKVVYSIRVDQQSNVLAYTPEGFYKLEHK